MPDTVSNSHHPLLISRRGFLGSGILTTTALASGLALETGSAAAAVVKENTDPDGGLKLGVASYSLRKFSLDEAIAITKKAGVRYLTLKDMHLPMKSTTEERKAVAQKIRDAGLVLMGGGVIYMKNNEEEIRAAFDYARDAGMPVIVCSPDPAALSLVEKFAREYDLKIAIHNHGPGDDKYPSPMDVLRLVRDLDPRMGICMDLGHTVRINQDPLPIIRACAKRLHDFHIKDVTAPTDKGVPIEVGRGIIDIVGVLKALRRINFNGHLALEYEINPENPLPGMAESFAYIRGALAALS